jgi:hypothetical protein
VDGLLNDTEQSGEDEENAIELDAAATRPETMPQKPPQAQAGAGITAHTHTHTSPTKRKQKAAVESPIRRRFYRGVVSPTRKGRKMNTRRDVYKEDEHEYIRS